MSQKCFLPKKKMTGKGHFDLASVAQERHIRECVCTHVHAYFIFCTFVLPDIHVHVCFLRLGKLVFCLLK